MKICGSCGEEKSREDFYPDLRLRDRLKKDCKACHRASAGKWQAENRERSRLRKREWHERNPGRAAALRQMRLYGVTEEQIRTENFCRICGSKEQLAWDHDHVTSKTRGRLCGKCNRGLGLFQDNPELLVAAANYLREEV